MKKKQILLFFTIETVIIILSYVLIQQDINLPECYIYNKFNILCPSCGGTRCIKSLFKGDIIEAFKYNKVYFITIAYIIILNIVIIINLVTRKQKMKAIYPRLEYLYFFITILIIYFIFRNLF